MKKSDGRIGYGVRESARRSNYVVCRLETSAGRSDEIRDLQTEKGLNVCLDIGSSSQRYNERQKSTTYERFSLLSTQFKPWAESVIIIDVLIILGSRTGASPTD